MKSTGRGPGQPDSKDDVINKHGEYEVQANNGTENDFPQIAQGLARQTARQLKQEKDIWYHQPGAKP